MRRIFLFLVLLFSIVGCSSVPSVAPATSGIQWTYAGAHDYEAEQPGLGKSYRYQSNMGWTDLYIYSLGRSNWRDGTTDDEFGKHFESVVRDIRIAGAKGFYKDISIGRSEDVTVAGLMFRHVTANFTANGKLIESHVYLTASGGQLIKYRMSFFKPVPANLAQEIEKLIQQSMDQRSHSQAI